MPEVTADSIVRFICGGCLALTVLLALLTLAGVLNARHGGQAMERAAAFVLTLFASAMGLVALWAVLGGLDTLEGSARQFARIGTGMLSSVGLTPVILSIQASLVSVLVAGLAWRFAVRDGSRLD